MKTATLSTKEIRQTWYLIDAEGKPLGRLASRIASLLRGKHRAEFSPHLDLGDHVVVINAAKVEVTGKKRQQKLYYSYSGYQGGLKVRTFQEVMDRDPRQVIVHAVKGMLPHNRLGRRLLKKLRVYPGGEHPHQAQKPRRLELQEQGRG